MGMTSRRKLTPDLPHQKIFALRELSGQYSTERKVKCQLSSIIKCLMFDIPSINFPGKCNNSYKLPVYIQVSKQEYESLAIFFPVSFEWGK